MPFIKPVASHWFRRAPFMRLVVINLDLILAWVSACAAFYLRVDRKAYRSFNKYMYSFWRRCWIFPCLFSLGFIALFFVTAVLTCPQFPYQSKFQNSKVCKINLFLR